jgi:uncharacterized membrane protein YeaQ/YmgE (transglycosylase-associated protein family)
MPEMGIIGWIVVGFIAGALSGYFFGERSPSGCLPNIVIGVVGGILGGFVAQEMFGLDQTVGFLGALIVAFLGAVLVRFILRAVSTR